MDYGLFAPDVKNKFPGKYEEWPHPIFNRTGADIEVGSVVLLDIYGSATETSAADWTSDSDGAFGNGIVPAATVGTISTGLVSGFFALALSPAADNESFRGLASGKASMLVLPTAATSTETFSRGARIMPTESQVYGTVGNGTMGTANKIIGMVYADGFVSTDGVAAESIVVWFNGVMGFPCRV